MLIGQAIETANCFDEGVLPTAADASIGWILGALSTVGPVE